MSYDDLSQEHLSREDPNHDDPSHEELDRLRQAFITTLPSDLPAGNCPTADEIWQATHDELSATQMREVIEHVAICATCTEVWRVAQQLEETPVAMTSARRFLTSPPGWARGLAAAVAASLVLTLGTLAYRVDRQPLPPAIDRTVVSTEGLRFLVEAPLPKQECVLRWRGPEGTEYYRLRVTSAADPLSEPLVEESRLKVSEYRIAEATLALLPPGSRLQAHIEAISPTGGSTDADVFHFEVE